MNVVGSLSPKYEYIKRAIKYLLSSYIFMILSDLNIWLVSSLYFEKLIILTIVFCIMNIGWSLVGYVLVQVILQYIKYGYIIVYHKVVRLLLCILYFFNNIVFPFIVINMSFNIFLFLLGPGLRGRGPSLKSGTVCFYFYYF